MRLLLLPDSLLYWLWELLLIFIRVFFGIWKAVPQEKWFHPNSWTYGFFSVPNHSCLLWVVLCLLLLYLLRVLLVFESVIQSFPSVHVWYRWVFWFLLHTFLLNFWTIRHDGSICCSTISFGWFLTSLALIFELLVL